MLAGGGARGHGRAAARAVFENDVRFDGWISTGIDNLPAQTRAILDMLPPKKVPAYSNLREILR